MAPTGLKFTVGSTWRMDLDTFRKDRQKPTDSNISGEKDHPNFCNQQKRSPPNGFYRKKQRKPARWRTEMGRRTEEKLLWSGMRLAYLLILEIIGLLSMLLKLAISHHELKCSTEHKVIFKDAHTTYGVLL